MTNQRNLEDAVELMSETVWARSQTGSLVTDIAHVIEEDFSMTAVTVLQENAAALRATVTGLTEKIDALKGRLSDNPSEAEVAAVAADLGELSADLSTAGAAIDAIDPDAEGGVIADPESDGDVIDGTET